jgi:hypothetical protein
MTCGGQMVVRQHIVPDLVVTILTEDSYNKEDKSEWTCYFSFKDNISLSVKTDNGEEIIGWDGGHRYEACKIVDDIIYVLDHKLGWTPCHPVIQATYNDKIADKELLGV